MNITIEQLVDFIKQSTETKEFKVDSRDWYATRDGFSTEYTEVINPATLIYLLGGLESNNA
jgi:hypothetical protein